MQVSPITASDYTKITALQPEGWSDIMPLTQFYVNATFCSPLKFEEGTELVGIGTVIYHQSSAWLAHIIVHKEYWGKGIGTYITHSLLKQINRENYRTVSLIATDLGSPVYLKAGFKNVCDYVFLKKELSDDPSEKSDHVRSFRPEDQDAILQLDLECSGENRAAVLLPHLRNAFVWEKEAIKGFYLPTLNEGLIVSLIEEAGIALLAQHQRPHVVLPETNNGGLDSLLQNGYKIFRRSPRMQLGEPLAFKGNMLYNRIGGNLG